MEISSLHLKTALMAYYRFKKQSLVADEVKVCRRYLADVLIDTGKELIEVECKTNLSDLKADAKKGKHVFYKEQPDQYAPDKFYLCVPSSLLKQAKEWIEKVNPNYGVIEFSQAKYEKLYKFDRQWENMLFFSKKAKNLRKEYRTRVGVIAKRASSSCINFQINSIRRMENDRQNNFRVQPLDQSVQEPTK